VQEVYTLAPLGTTRPEENADPNRSVAGSSSYDVVTRRSLRAAAAKPTKPAKAIKQPSKTRAVAVNAAPASTAVEKAGAKKASRKSTKRSIINMAVMTLAAGLVATMAIPAYAFNPKATAAAQFGTSAIDGMRKAQPQTVAVSQTVAEAAVSRDAVTATSVAELARQKAAAQLVSYAKAYKGPSAAQLVKAPVYAAAPVGNQAAIFAAAQKYIGTPYVFGGATPAGFDCSGYIMFVYAQFGISLPHSVSGEAARGTRVSLANAVPGDVVIMSGHDGFYAGNGNIMDAPAAGRSVSIRPIWTTSYYIVRIG
jgi:cell wall-associated NlpC family hydrolase